MSTPSLQTLTLENSTARGLSVRAAQTILQSYIEPITELETIALQDAFGRVVAQDVVSPINVPPHDNSAMDGYAFHSRILNTNLDTHLNANERVKLRIAGLRLAGPTEVITLENNECVRIMTGACIPEACDTVVPQEWCEVVQDDSSGESFIQFDCRKMRAGDNRRLAGEDLARGKTIVTQGTRLHAAEVGLLASVGISHISVYRKLRVAYFSTGNELRSLGETLDAGCIYDSNRYTLSSLLRAMHVEVIDLGVIPDQPDELKSTLIYACQEADAVLTSGGVSMGAADFTKQVMLELGDIAFWGLEMRPGRPMAFGQITAHGRRAYLFGLPGNPVASMLNFLFLSGPALQQLQGLKLAKPLLLPAIAAHPIRKRPGRTEFQRCIVHVNEQGQLLASITGAQGSGILRSMAEANAILVLDDDCGDVAAGDKLQVHLLHGLYSSN